MNAILRALAVLASASLPLATANAIPPPGEVVAATCLPVESPELPACVGAYVWYDPATESGEAAGAAPENCEDAQRFCVCIWNAGPTPGGGWYEDFDCYSDSTLPVA